MHVIKNIFLTIALLLLFSAIDVSGAPSDHELDRLQDLVETGRADSASVILNGILDTELPTDTRVRALYLLSQAMNRLGRLGDEIRYLVMAREESDGTDYDDSITRDYARILLQTGNYDECIAVTEAFRDRNIISPIWVDIVILSADAMFQKEEYRRAFNIYSEISGLFPDTTPGIRAILYSGICLYRLDIVGGATEYIEEYLAQYPSGPDTDKALWHLGASYEALGNTRQAITAYKRLVVEFPYYDNIIDIYFKLGENYLAIDQLTDAEHALYNFIDNADSTNSNFDTALLDIERIRMRNGHYYNEISMYEHFITDHPASSLTPRIIFDLARYYKTAGNRAQALEKYRILTSNDRYAAYADSAAFLIADLFIGDYDIDRAVEALVEMTESFSDPARIQNYYLRIGDDYENWGNTEQAIAWYDSAYSNGAAEKISVEALLGIGRILKKQDRWLEAENIYTRILDEFPGNPKEKTIYLALSDIHYLAGNLVESAANAEKAVKFADDVEKTQILLYIAELYEDIDEQHALVLYGLVFNNEVTPRPDKTEALMKYGDLAIRIGEREKAAEAFVTVIEDSADSVAVNLARTKLSSIFKNTQ